MLTAQEVLDQEGYIPFCSTVDRKAGDIVEVDGGKFVPIGTKLVIVGDLSIEEADALASRIGWPPHNIRSPWKMFKAVVE